MTPEERARADEITAAIERFAKDRKKAPAATIPGISPKPPAPTMRVVSQTPPTRSTPIQPASIPGISRSSRTLTPTLLICLTITLNVAGFIGYKIYTDYRDREEAKEMIRQAEQSAAAAMSEASRMTQELTKQFTQAMPSPAFQTAQSTTPQRERVTPTIEYNVVRTQPPAPRPQPVQTYQPAPPEPAPVDRKPAHIVVATNYIRMKSGLWDAQATSTEQVPGWDGRYRTEFEIPRSAYAGTTSPKPKRYEVITEEKAGKITALEITTKGYY